MQSAAARVREEELRGFVNELLIQAGADAAAAAAVTRAVVGASARGVDTHGVRLVPLYVSYLQDGRARANVEPVVTTHSASAATIDAGDGFGHLASYLAIERGIEMARETGVAVVTVRRSTHHGATGGYALAAAEQGFVCVSMTNTDRVVVPHGGLAKFFGTNPIGFAMPAAGGEPPLLIDMATSAIPFNRVFLRRSTGESLPAAVAVNDLGEPVEDPNAATALLPLGGLDYAYKGAALATMVELLCSGLAGAPIGPELPSFFDNTSEPGNVSHFFLLIDPRAFTPPGGTEATVSHFRDLLRRQPSRPGAHVMAAGDPEIGFAAERRVSGIPIDPVSWTAFNDLATRFGVTPLTAL